jgi:nucleotide-binding universal stress UspA family protein
MLIAGSMDATMLVLGTQGHGGLRGVDLGSTADKCYGSPAAT